MQLNILSVMLSKFLKIFFLFIIFAGLLYFIQPEKNNSAILAVSSLKSCADYKNIRQVKIQWNKSGVAICESASTDLKYKNQFNSFFSKPGEFVLNLNPSIAGWPTTIAANKTWPDPDFPPQDTIRPASLVWEAKDAGPSGDFTIDLECIDDSVSGSFLLLSMATRTETEGQKQWMIENPNGTYRTYRPGSTTEKANYDLVKQTVKTVGYKSYFWGASRDLAGVFSGKNAIRSENGYDYCDSQFCGLGWKPGSGSAFFPMATGMATARDEESGQYGLILHYCQGYSGEFSIAVDKNAEPDTKIYLDPDYIEKTKKERGFRPTEPINPFDDIICELKLPKKKYPSTDNLNAKLIAGSIDDGETEITGGILEYSPTNSEADKDYNYFQWKIKGWPDSWASGDEKTKANLLEKIVTNGNVECRATLPDGIGISHPHPVNLCVRLEGGKNAGTFGITTVRTKNIPFSALDAVRRAINDMKYGYQKIDPFKTFNNKFYFNVDLQNIGNPAWDKYKYLELDMQGYSSCKESRVYNIYSINGLDGRACINGKNTSLGTSLIFSGTVHETGHAFCALEDEYKMNFMPPSGYPNCFNISDIPNGFNNYGRPYAICGSPNRSRTSYCSLMGCGDEFETINGDYRLRPEKLNTWGCGVCLSKIDSKGTLKDNAKYCRDNNFDVVNINEKPASPDGSWECINSADCATKKNINWDSICIDDCVANKCVSRAGKDCKINVKNISSGIWITNINGECGSKEAGTEGKCVETKYSCIKSTGECVKDANGQFSSINSCKPGCPKPK